MKGNENPPVMDEDSPALFEVVPVNQTKTPATSDAALAVQWAGLLIIAAGVALALWGAPLSGATLLALLVQLIGAYVGGPVAHSMVHRAPALAVRPSAHRPCRRSASGRVDFVWGTAA